MVDDTHTRPLAAIILAAGQGTRMKSGLHKVLHPIAGRPMLLHLIDSVNTLSPARTLVVVGARREQVEAVVAPHGVEVIVQAEQLGTGHAVRQAEQALGGFAGDVLILYGDVPMVTPATMRRMRDRLHAEDKPATVVLGFRPPDPGAYGRVIADAAGRIDRMVEFKDANEAERAETLCNSGLMAVRGDDLFALLARVGNDNAAGEFYLVDIVNVAGADGRASAVIETAADEVAGVNSRGELAGVERAWQQSRRGQAMTDGATLIAPETVWFSHDTKLGRDVTIEPSVVFGPGVSVADGATIHAFSHLEGAIVGERASVGPYARLRPGTVLERDAKVGNFVEMKKARLGEGAKASHLTYLGDADVGAGANIGAGTITCNYDGYFKYQTVIGAGAFIGSNTALVAPVTIGDGAIVGAGAVITEDVEADALALVRPPQTARPGWAARFRVTMIAKSVENDIRRYITSDMASRVLVSLGEERQSKLDRLADRRGESRSALIRTAVDKLIDEEEQEDRREEFKHALDAAFGIWKDRTDIGDAVEWQRRERAGWTRPWDQDYDEVRAEFPDLFDAETDRERAYWKEVYARRGENSE